MPTPSEILHFRTAPAEAVAPILHKEFPRVLRAVRLFAIDEDEAYDLVQETWVRVLRTRRSYKGQGNIGAWIRQVARSVCLDWLRKHERRPERLTAWMADHIASEVDIERETERRHTLDRVYGQFSRLSPREAEAVMLRLVEGLSVTEAAREMGVSAAAVRSAHSRGVARLRDAMRGAA